MSNNNLNNDQVVPYIAYGNNATNRGGSFWGKGDPRSAKHYRASQGYVPRKVGAALDAAAERLGGITGIIFSYGTPIAVEIAGVWLRPDVTYSATTSGKHATHLWQLRPRWVPADASEQDIYDIINGYVEYNASTGKMQRGWNTRHEAGAKR